MIVLVIIISAITIGIGSIYFLGGDNIVEQAAEEIIFLETGKRIDLSPELDEEIDNTTEK